MIAYILKRWSLSVIKDVSIGESKYRLKFDEQLGINWYQLCFSCHFDVELIINMVSDTHNVYSLQYGFMAPFIKGANIKTEL